MEWIVKGVRTLIREPVRITGIVLATIGLGGAFDWWEITTAQSDAVMTFLGALLVVFGTFLTTPANDPVLRSDQSVRIVGGGTGKVVRDDG